MCRKIVFIHNQANKNSQYDKVFGVDFPSNKNVSFCLGRICICHLSNSPCKFCIVLFWFRHIEVFVPIEMPNRYRFVVITKPAT